MFDLVIAEKVRKVMPQECEGHGANAPRAGDSVKQGIDSH